MKKAKVKYPYSEDLSEGILFESIDDIKIIEKELKKSEESVIKKFAMSGEPSSRLDHIINGFKPLEQVIASHACLKSSINEDNPIFYLRQASTLYLKTLVSTLKSGYKMFMNVNGGLCPCDDYLEIVETSEFKEFYNKPKTYLLKGSKVINLENDFELERDAVDYMYKRFDKFSYITELSLISKFHLKRILKSFFDNGGEFVYVYTTGRNIEQMYMYSECAITQGLKKFIFHFNCGEDSEIKKFIKWLKSKKGINVELIK